MSTDSQMPYVVRYLSLHDFPRLRPTLASRRPAGGPDDLRAHRLPLGPGPVRINSRRRRQRLHPAVPGAGRGKTGRHQPRRTDRPRRSLHLQLRTTIFPEAITTAPSATDLRLVYELRTKRGSLKLSRGAVAVALSCRDSRRWKPSAGSTEWNVRKHAPDPFSRQIS